MTRTYVNHRCFSATIMKQAFILLAGLGTVLSFQSSLWLEKPKRTPEQIFTQLCSGCHGERMQAFVDRQWKHGNSPTELTASITNGWADKGMPAFGQTLSKKEIQNMVLYIREGIKDVEKYSFKADKPQDGTTFQSEGMTLKLEKIADGLDSPWGMAFLPGGDMLITDRNGKMYRRSTSGQLQAMSGVPEVLAEGQGGLLDVELHPNFAQNQVVYISYSAFIKKEGEKTLSTTAVMRARLDGTALVDGKVIFEAQPYLPTRYHYGNRLEFSRDGFLYLSVGDRGMQNKNPQLLNTHGGKVHRIKDDGSIPADNPFVGQGDAMGSIYSFGHRNPQGMAIHPETGEIWTHEHGPRGGDEINIVKKAHNYGWPVISYGINYDGTSFTKLTAKDGMDQPLHYWVPSIGPSGMVFVKGDRYPGWKGNLMVGSLRFEYLNRCVIKDGKVVKEEPVLPKVGRLRNVEMSPDGYLYIAVEQPGIVYRIVRVGA